MTNQKNPTTTITIRLTETEKNAIICKARSRRESITRFVIESAVTNESRRMKDLRPILIKIRTLTDTVKEMNKSLCERGLRTAGDTDAEDPALDDIVDLQRDIFSLLQEYAANGGR